MQHTDTSLWDVLRRALGLPILVALLALHGCGGSSGGSTSPTPLVRGPSISGFSPQSGAPGTLVTIAGANFSLTAGGNTVAFNDMPASVVGSVTTTQIVASVPAGALSGPISVTTAGGVAYSASSFTVLPTAAVPPSAPGSVAAAAGNTQVSVSWGAVAGADSYNIYWSTTSGVTKLNGNKITNATSPYVHTGLANGTAVYYVVTAQNSAGESVESAEVNATPMPTIPAAPANIAAVAADSQNAVSWDSSFGATSYNLYWSTTAGVTKLNGTQVVGVTSPYVHFGLTNGQTYYYVITALNSAGESVESAEVSAAPVASALPPAAPASIAAMAGNGQISLTWGAVAGASSYNIYWSNINGVTKATGTQIASAMSPYTHTALTNGAVYYYVVTAVNANGESADSAQASAIPTATPNTWTTGPSLSISHISAVAGVINGKLYVVGGSTGSGTIGTGSTTMLEMYDPVTNVWTTKASALSSRAAASGGVIDGKLYVAGGCIGSDCRIGVVNTLEAYDPVANTWTTLAPMPTRRYNAAAGVVNGRLYLAGGGSDCPPCGALNVVESYDPVSNTWRSEPSMPLTLANTAGAAINDVLYVVGGYDWTTGVSNATLAFDPVMNSWTTRATMPTPRHTAGSVTSLNGLMYVIGGSTATAVTNVVEVYDPVSNLWTTRTSLPVGKWGVGIGVLNGRIHVTGGIDGSNNFLTAMDIYVP